MSVANQSGKKLESHVLDKLSSFSTKTTNKKYSIGLINTTVPQYIYKDIFTDKARVDFLYVNSTGKRFFIECKNQSVPGSVDTKFPYYIFNMQQNMYKDSKFIFILNHPGIRAGVMECLIKQAPIYKFYIVSLDRLQELDSILEETCTQYVFI